MLCMPEEGTPLASYPMLLLKDGLHPNAGELASVEKDKAISFGLEVQIW